jgi:DNA modification methylase
MGKITEVQEVPVSKLIPYVNNAKIHSEEQVTKIASSIREFGFVSPILIDKDFNVIAGHGRLMAAKKLDMENVPCLFIEGLSEAQRKAYILADNRLSELAEWDMDLVMSELDGLKDMDFDIELTGFDMPDTEETTEIQEDSVPDVPEEAVCKLGDLWELGEHRLICGDSTDINVVDRLMDGVKADMVFTDPPYNMSDHLTGFANEKTKRALSTIVDFDPNTVTDTLFAIKTNNYFIFTSKELIPKYFKIFEEWGFNILVWCKDNPTPMTNNTFLPDVEYLLYFYKNGRVWNNGLDVSVYKKYYNSNKMEGRKEAGNVHPTIKPIKIIADKIQICSNKNGIVVDLFGGSGSTLIACEQLNRKCHMCELDPHYCDVIIQRWENFTGKKAKLVEKPN